MADVKRSGGRNTRRRLLSGVAVLLLVFPGICLAQGLKLDTAKDKEADEYDRPNPHFELECAECHGERPAEGTTWETVKFVNGDGGNVKLCYTCHEVSDNIHPIDVDPKTGTPPVRVPDGFPLEKIGVHKGAVVCSTCHFIHAKTAGLKLLRGFPESSHPDEIQKARFKDRRELCRGCHGEKLKDKSPHKGKVVADEKAKRTCSFCHAKEPKEGEAIQFTKSPVELCDFCHAATKGGHFLLVNPFADPNLTAQIKTANLPLYKGEYTCVSCHNPHGGTGEEKFLRKEFVVLALQSTRVRPHFMKAFCEACHKVRPKFPKGDPNAEKLAAIPLRTENLNELCNRCHESGLTKANAHPILKPSEKYLARIPKDWPLQDGLLTCMTCHTGGDSPTLDPKNPTFLRGGPYETRNTMCWTCHKQEEFRATNPHQDINAGEGCTFCHSTKPNRDKSVNLESMKFKGDIVLLCIRCHDANPHPANKDHTGVPDAEIVAKNNIKIPKDFPLDRIGRMTCATCHNPHAGGEQRGVMVGMEICSSCHQF